jgi:hypothetical protein
MTGRLDKKSRPAAQNLGAENARTGMQPRPRRYRPQRINGTLQVMGSENWLKTRNPNVRAQHALTMVHFDFLTRGINVQISWRRVAET